MTTQDKLAEALELARNGLCWYQEHYPDEVNGCDDEAITIIDAALQAHAAEAVQAQPYTLDCSLADKIELALRDAGFPLDEASALSMSLSAQAQAQPTQDAKDAARYR